MKTKIFISKGSSATQEQRKFVDSILAMIKTVGLSSRIMNENEWSHEQPLKAIRKIIKECDGAVVIAFTRTCFEKGIELKKEQSMPITNIHLPTTWNHIEASLAYSYDIPLLVIAENGLKREGLIEDGYDWRVYWTDLEPNIGSSESFIGFLKSWKNSVEERKKEREKKRNTDANKQILDELNIEKISIGKFIKIIPISQLWRVIIIAISILTSVAVGSYALGADKWPWQVTNNIENKEIK